MCKVSGQSTTDTELISGPREKICNVIQRGSKRRHPSTDRENVAGSGKGNAAQLAPPPEGARTVAMGRGLPKQQHKLPPAPCSSTDTSDDSDLSSADSSDEGRSGLSPSATGRAPQPMDALTNSENGMRDFNASMDDGSDAISTSDTKSTASNTSTPSLAGTSCPAPR